MIRRLLLSISLIGMCLLAAPQTAGAFDLFKGVDCSGQATSSTVCKSRGNTGNPIAGPHSLLINITNIIAYIAGAAAIIIIIVSALKFITSGSDVSKGGRVDDDVANARRALVSALVGLAVIILARTVITYVIKKL